MPEEPTPIFGRATPRDRLEAVLWRTRKLSRGEIDLIMQAAMTYAESERHRALLDVALVPPRPPRPQKSRPRVVHLFTGRPLTACGKRVEDWTLRTTFPAMVTCKHPGCSRIRDAALREAGR